ncbi:MAG: M20/M25/M40 family metallo-hydrolase, partial [Armatimonadota bacterium]
MTASGNPPDSPESRAVRDIHAHVDAHWDDHLEATRLFLRQPSISADGTGIEAMAQMVADRMRQIGAWAEVSSTGGHPVIYGTMEGDGSRTVLLYGMYDVQPVAGESWIADPFAAEIVEQPAFGPCVVARGVSNTKGPLAGMFNVLESIRAVRGTLPINVKFLIEGEEELGSRHLPAFIDAHLDRLHADAGFFPFYRQDVAGKPIIHLGCKGVIFFELTSRGGDHGGPVTGAVHGSRAVWFHNPAWDLVHALGTLVSSDQTRVLVDGFYGDAAGPTDEDERLLAALERTFDGQAQLREFGVPRFKYDLNGVPLLRKYL